MRVMGTIFHPLIFEDIHITVKITGRSKRKSSAMERQNKIPFIHIMIFTSYIISVDTMPPTITLCPSDFTSVGGRHVGWIEPDVFDISDNVTTIKSHVPGLFVTEETGVVYTFTDPSGNTANCTFTIYMKCKYLVSYEPSTFCFDMQY